MAFIAYLQSSMSKEHFEALFRFLFLIVLAILGVGLGVLTLSGKVAPWTGRSVVNMEGELQQVAQSAITQLSPYLNRNPDTLAACRPLAMADGSRQNAAC